MPAKQGEAARQLYNLKEDPYQKNNRIDDYPDRASAMAARLKEMLKERGMTADKISVKARKAKNKKGKKGKNK